MKTNFLVFFLLLVVGVESAFARERGKPFLPYIDKPYTAKEISSEISKDSVKVWAYMLEIQQYANQYGWPIPGDTLTFEHTVAMVGDCDNEYASWKNGEVSVTYLFEGNLEYFTRPSYSSYPKHKKEGREPVIALDVTRKYGWKDANGRSFPKVILESRWCGNAIYDKRYKIFPVSPLIKKGDSLLRQNIEKVYLDEPPTQEQNGQSGIYYRNEFVPCYRTYVQSCGCWQWYYYIPTYAPCYYPQYFVRTCPPIYQRSCYTSVTYIINRTTVIINQTSGQGVDPPKPDPGGSGIDPYEVRNGRSSLGGPEDPKKSGEGNSSGTKIREKLPVNSKARPTTQLQSDRQSVSTRTKIGDKLPVNSNRTTTQPAVKPSERQSSDNLAVAKRTIENTVQNVQPSNTRNYTQPSNTNTSKRTYTQPSNTRNYTQPSNTNTSQRTYTQPSNTRNYTQPSNTNTSQRTYTQPSNTRNYTQPSNTNTSQRTYTQPSNTNTSTRTSVQPSSSRSYSSGSSGGGNRGGGNRTR